MSYIDTAQDVFDAVAHVWTPQVFASREDPTKGERVGILTMTECARLADRIRKYRVTAGDINAALWEVKESAPRKPDYRTISKAVVTAAIQIAGDRDERQRQHHPDHLHPFWCDRRKRVATAEEVASDLETLAQEIRQGAPSQSRLAQVCERRAARIRRLGRPPTADENVADVSAFGVGS